MVPAIQAGLRQYLHRMTVCLGEELLPFIPLASQVLLKSSSIQSLSEYIPLINQVIAKFKVIHWVSSLNKYLSHSLLITVIYFYCY